MSTEGTLNLEQKLSILSQISNGFKLTDLAKEYEVELCEIVETEAERAAISELVCSSYFDAAELMAQRSSLNPRMENILYMWYMTESKMHWVTNKNIRHKALELNRIVSENTRPFKASSKWCVAFKNRYSIDNNNVNNDDTLPKEEMDSNNAPGTSGTSRTSLGHGVFAAAVVNVENGLGFDVSSQANPKSPIRHDAFIGMHYDGQFPEYEDILTFGSVEQNSMADVVDYELSIDSEDYDDPFKYQNQLDELLGVNYSLSTDNKSIIPLQSVPPNLMPDDMEALLIKSYQLDTLTAKNNPSQNEKRQNALRGIRKDGRICKQDSVINKRLKITPNVAVNIFSQALEWADENAVSRVEKVYLRKFYNRAVRERETAVLVDDQNTPTTYFHPKI